jgi:hypothetical protein
VGLTRRNVWLTGIVIVMLMVVFPPWFYFDANTSNQRSAGYHFLLSPPPLKNYEEMFGFVYDDMPPQFVSVHLNRLRLITQLLTVAFLTIGLGLRLRGNSSLSSGCLMALGICGVLLLILLMSTKF